MELKKVKKRELLSFYESDFYKNLIHIPFTLLRLASYINNPYSDEEDIVLYYVLIENEIVSYRIVLHDKLFNNDIVVWSCGNWTNSLHRKKGFSTLLYKEIQKDYNDKFLVYTRTLEAIAFYKKQPELFFYDDKVSKELQYSFDFLIDKKIVKPFRRFIKRIGRKRFNNDETARFDFSLLNDKTAEFLEKHSEMELFPLTTEKVKWILKYPWISTIDVDNKQIFDFSLVDLTFKAAVFERRLNNEVKAFYYRNIRQNTFYLHYAYYDNEEEAKLIARSILAEFNVEEIKCIIVRDQLIMKYIEEVHRPFIKKSYKNFLFIDSSKKNVLARKIQHGIGELIFT